MLYTRAVDNIVFIAYLNAVGGQDELVFDGHSMIFNQDGILIARGKQFKEDLIIADLELENTLIKRLHAPLRRQEIIRLDKASIEKISIPKSKKLGRRILTKSYQNSVLEPMEEIYSALVLGTSDYIKKNDFKGAVIGVSGGIDSALVAAIATDALGKENVHALFMPSIYTSKESIEDANELAKRLGIKIIEISINDIFQSYIRSLNEHFKGLKSNVTEENIQARIRGNLLMAFSNKFGWIVLTTGNKSEMSVGYATLYGDMAGGFAVIKDVPKTMVYELCRWRNKKAGEPIIPERMFTKEPSAELKEGQKDSDILPPYAELDPILKAYIEEDKGFHEILATGCEIECAQKVIRMVDRSEYKRRQSPPGIKITARAFGRDRRFPITNKYRGF